MDPVKYRQPRAINVVSVIVVLTLLAAGYAGYEIVMGTFLQQEAYRVLEETSSTFAGRRQLYRKDDQQREQLRVKMESQIRSIGVTDPDLETWIDVDGTRSTFGVVFTAYYHWPFDVLEPIPHEHQLEHELVMVD